MHFHARNRAHSRLNHLVIEHIDRCVAANNILNPEPIGDADNRAKISRVLNVVERNSEPRTNLLRIDFILREVVDGDNIGSSREMRHTLQLSLGSEHNLAEMTRMTERIVPLLCSNNHTAREIVPSVADSLRAFDCENAIFHPIFLFIERSDHFDNVISNFHSTKIIQKGEKRNEKAQKNESRQKTALADKIIDLKFLSIQKHRGSRRLSLPQD